MKTIANLNNEEIYKWYLNGFITDEEIGIDQASTWCELEDDLVVFTPPDGNEENFNVSIEVLRTALSLKDTKELTDRGLKAE